MPRAYPHLKPGFNPNQKPQPKLGIVDNYLEFDDGNNALGWVAFRMATGKIYKYHFTYENSKQRVCLYVDRPSKTSKIWRRFQTNNILVEGEVWKLLRRENVVSEKLLKRVFARFE